MVRNQRTNEELVKASEHLFYELWMLINLANVQATGAFGKGVINNALLESFTIHARVLLDFLYSKNPREDDVIADDFLVDQDTWKSKRPAKSKTIESIHQRVGKEVAHLTYARHDVTPETKPWPFVEIANEVNSIFTKFMDLAPPALFGPSWKTQDHNSKEEGNYT